MLEMMRPRVRRTKKDRGVDPKAFLCNERTTFQWLNFMMLYSLFAVSLSSKVRVRYMVSVCNVVLVSLYLQTPTDFGSLGENQRMIAPWTTFLSARHGIV